MLFMGRSGASSVVLGSLRDSSSAATEPATIRLNPGMPLARCPTAEILAATNWPQAAAR